ncbi:DpnII family type II restriction endonuclease [Erysipelothrix rhusiopathiae]|nr:DpnII family type II restriction endonuclease [Erysipelothrix rhusiopathiae]MDE8321987.1 DpnII family type II restriction endonuclease [Erysipelothrix rhusiopathiae]
MKNNISPAVKWVGGKTQLLDAIEPLLPRDFNTYYEPFLGGGAILFAAQPKNAVVNDINRELMSLYKTIKNDHKSLIKELRKMVKLHNADASNFYQLTREIDVNDLNNDLDTAKRFLYLNKTGFNGLYRVNSKGEFNVPFNKKEEIKITTLCNAKNFERMSNYLNENNVRLYNTDFQKIIDQAESGDFIFVDSPYDDAFTGYSSDRFGSEEHIRLSESLKRANSRGVKWMLTNHNTDLINKLYDDFFIFEVPVNRFINSDAQNRANATNEVIIINYYDELNEIQLRNFEEAKFFKQLKPTSFVLKDYVKWEKIQERVKENRLKLNDLNLLNSNTVSDFEVKFKELHSQRAEAFSILPLFLANRSDKYEYWLNSGETGLFDWEDEETTYQFLIDSGLRDNLFLNPTYTSVFDYMLGLEVGLTSNDKKNLTGQWMGTQIEMILKNNGVDFEKEVSYESIIKAGRIKDKKFDYKFEKDDQTYCVEVNFFNTNGSKINSEAGRFIDLDNSFRDYDKTHFIWVTDGVGLRKSKPDITNALRRIKYMFNLTTFEEFIKSL